MDLLTGLDLDSDMLECGSDSENKEEDENTFDESPSLKKREIKEIRKSLGT